MLQNVEEAQQLGTTADSTETLNEILARAGVSIPTMRDVAPFQAERLRPRWLAFLIRVFAPRS
jgi:ribosomal protein S11